MNALDKLGLAIANAGYTWTPEMRQAYEEGIKELEAAVLAEREKLAEQEPVAQYEMLTDDEIQMLWVNWDANRTSEWYECIEDLVHVVEDYIIQKQTETNPLGYLDESDLRGLAQGNAVWMYPENQGRMVAVYATPVRAKDLTDEEITTIGCAIYGDTSVPEVAQIRIEFARAVIAADREKNK